MEELSTIFNNVGILVAALAGGISLVMFGFAGIQYMTAQGDPQAMGRAKMSVIGAVVGLGIAGLAFVMPGVVSRLIVEPAGGQNVAGDSVGTNCDQLLRNQLVFQRGASTAARINEVIRQIQAQRDNCVSELWDPEADETTSPPANCDTATSVGSMNIPRGLSKHPQPTPVAVRDDSGRDSDNNIVVHWNTSKRPADGAGCWLYVSRLNQWGENY